MIEFKYCERFVNQQTAQRKMDKIVEYISTHPDMELISQDLYDVVIEPLDHQYYIKIFYYAKTKEIAEELYYYFS